jgi:hypothetical protein
MSHVTDSTSTVIRIAPAEALTGPHVDADGFSAHIQFGIPTTSNVPGFGAIPNVIGRRGIRASSDRANCSGDADGGNHTQPRRPSPITQVACT